MTEIDRACPFNRLSHAVAVRLLQFATMQPCASEISYSDLAPGQGFEP